MKPVRLVRHRPWARLSAGFSFIIGVPPSCSGNARVRRGTPSGPAHSDSVPRLESKVRPSELSSGGWVTSRSALRQIQLLVALGEVPEFLRSSSQARGEPSWCRPSTAPPRESIATPEVTASGGTSPGRGPPVHGLRPPVGESCHRRLGWRRWHLYRLWARGPVWRGGQCPAGR